MLQGMVRPIIQKSGEAIVARAAGMASSMSDKASPNFSAQTTVGTIKRGRRVITTISADYSNSREEYIARQALAKARDAGRLN